MIDFRPIQAGDLIAVQDCNIKCLPENYQYKYYLYHYITWPRCSWVAVFQERIVGYILAKLDEDAGKLPWGHITSLAVLPEFRGMKIAESLMQRAESSLKDVYKVSQITLHVRISNLAAINLYTKKLSFEISNVDPKYYADGEDAYNMKKTI